MLISHQADLAALCAQLGASGAAGAPLAFDTEFVSEKRYIPQLCLVQVYMPAANGRMGALEAAIDPFALDLEPLLALIADPAIAKIVHAGSADLSLLWTGYQTAAQNVFDTQIAGAFLGYGHQIGYADLVRRITGVSLSKTLQYSDWSARPLSESQIDYALSDVRHLPPIQQELNSNLARRGRLDWARTEFARAEERAVTTESDLEAYRRLNASGMRRNQLAILREVAALRESIARDLDKPPAFIVPDLALVQMVRQMPTNVAQLRAIRGMPGLAAEHTRRFLETLAEAGAMLQEDWPPARTDERPDARLDAVTSLLGVVASARATAHDVARSYLAPREQLTALGTWWLKKSAGVQDDDPDLSLLKDWRAELLGNDLLRLLNAELAVVLDLNTGLPGLQELPAGEAFALPAVDRLLK